MGSKTVKPRKLEIGSASRNRVQSKSSGDLLLLQNKKKQFTKQLWDKKIEKSMKTLQKNSSFLMQGVKKGRAGGSAQKMV